MSQRAPAWFEQKYIDGVTHQIQSAGFLLKSAVMEASRIEGNIAYWRVAGSAEATLMSNAIEMASSMNLDRQLISATMQDWEANDYIRIMDIEKMSENEQAVVQKSGAMAIGRRFDRIIIGALDAATITNVGNGSAAITPLDVMAAQGAIADVGVGSYEYYCILPQVFLQQLELYREFSSSDYTGTAEYPLLMQVGARKWRGITFIPVPSAYLNVPAANQMDAYLFVKEAVGMAKAQDLRSRIDWVPEKKAWFAANDISAAAAVLLPTNGVRRLRFATNIALTRPSP